MNKNRVEVYGKKSVTFFQWLKSLLSFRAGWIETRQSKKIPALLERANGSKEIMFVPVE